VIDHPSPSPPCRLLLLPFLHPFHYPYLDLKVIDIAFVTFTFTIIALTTFRVALGCIDLLLHIDPLIRRNGLHLAFANQFGTVGARACVVATAYSHSSEIMVSDVGWPFV